jgi:hypothetical protein
MMVWFGALMFAMVFSCGGTAGGTAGDTGSVDTALEDTGPMDTGFALSEMCIFGDQSSDIHQSNHLDVRLISNYSEASQLPAIVEQQFLTAMSEEDLAVIENADEGFTFVDADVSHYELTIIYNGGKITWLHWWSGDTEVGYLFADDTTEIVAVISDGDIYKCTVMAPL